ncbi:MFS transporter [Streptomyces mirabilis]|uniref:MFS transporter n=1 Tax=Streptomyces mirabilis TaxID=68239 RepID=UPI0036587BD6
MTTVGAQPPTPSTATPPLASPKATASRWSVFAVLAAVAFMAQLDLFIVNVALPDMGGSFHNATLSSLSWVLNAYSIVLAALLVPSGRLADHFGRRRFLLAGVVLFTVASVVCAVAPSLSFMIIGRVLQGFGAAMVIPTSLGLLFPAFPREQHTLVVGLWAGVAAIAASLGPTVGGLLVAADWRLIFLINLPIGVAATLFGLRVLPEVRAQQGTRMPDPISGAALLVAVALLTSAMVQSTSWGWSGTGTVLFLAGAVAAGTVTVWRAFRHPHAVVEASLFGASREFSAASAALFLFFLAFSAWLLITVLFLQNTWHYGVIRTGLAIAPGPLSAAATALNAGRITGRFGRKTPAIAGTLLFAGASLFWLLATTLHPDYAAGFLPGLIIGGAGAGLTQAPLFAAAGTLPADRATTGSAVLNMARQVGSAIGVAILVTFLSGIPANSLTGYHRGWAFMIVACLACTTVVTLATPRRKH